MATFYGVNETKARAGNNFITGGQKGGKLRSYFDTYEAAAVAADSVLDFGALRNDGTLVDFQVWSDNLGGTTATIDFKVDTTTVHSALDISGAAAYADMKAAGSIDNVGLAVTAGDRITAVTATDAITGTVKVLVTVLED